MERNPSKAEALADPGQPGENMFADSIRSPASDGPLTGARVIDFGQYIAGPLAAMMLADQGADVIRVDPPGGPFLHTPANAMYNRGKKMVRLDLKSEAGQREARGLIESADVVIENFRPGVMNRLGLGAEEMLALNPRLIYLSLPGFSASDKEWAPVQAWEGVVAAAAGLYTDVCLTREFRGLPPLFTALPMASTYAAVHGAGAVALALFAREKDGVGEIIETSLASALMSSLPVIAMEIEDLPERYCDPTFKGLEDFKADGETDFSAELKKFANPFYTNYTCADGRLYFVCSDAHPKLCENTLRALGIWDEMVREGLPMEDPYRPSSEWRTPSNLFASNGLSLEWRKKLRTRMEEIFLKKPGEEWETLLGNAGVAGAIQRTSKEWMHTGHAQRSGLITRVDDADLGPMLQLGPLVWLKNHDNPSPDPGASRPSEPESLHTSPPRAGSAPDGTREKRCILQGVKVLDLTNVLAGPAAGAQFARYGAEVIKIDSPNPLFDPYCTIFYALDIGRGKKSILLDLHAEEGKEALHRLLRDTDILLYNTPDSGLERLGIDISALRKSNPGIILCHISAFGGPAPGPRTNHPGYDDTTQAATGVQSRFGSPGDPELHCNASTVDYLTGYSADFAGVLALLRRRKGRGGSHACTSLAAAAQLAQNPYMHDYPQRPPWNEPAGRRAVGERALYRIYEAADGWIFLGARPDQLADLSRIDEFSDIASPENASMEDDALAALLAERLLKNTGDYWVSRLRAAGVGAARVQTLKQIRQECLTAEGETRIEFTGKSIQFVRHQDHPMGRRVDLTTPNWIRFKNSLSEATHPAPKFGADTRAVLRAHGYSPAEIDALIAKGVAAESWSNTEQYLPE
ncbi:MAG: hypothetical protein GY859_43530 [Desulfobacterales bacterium]|nr:hypothetical protein [Desulfobacterales bacterium]